MSKQLDNLEYTYDKFNENYSKIRRMLVKAVREEDENPRESQLALTTLDNLDATLDDIVKVLKYLDQKTEVKP